MMDENITGCNVYGRSIFITFKNSDQSNFINFTNAEIVFLLGRMMD